MKDSLLKPCLTPPLLPKSKLGNKGKKMAAKRGKEHKTPILKVGRGKKTSNTNKRSKLGKDNIDSPVRRKRGRPRNEDRILTNKPIKEQKVVKKNEGKPGGRKRKLKVDIKIEKDIDPPPFKKPKVGDSFIGINGDMKMPNSNNHGSIFGNQESNSTAQHEINSNGTIHSKKTLVFGQKKPFSILKSATFHPPPKKEVLNGNSSLAQFKVQPMKNKSPFKKDAGLSLFQKESDMNSKFDKMTNVLVPFKDLREPVNNELFKFHAKDVPKFGSKDPLKSVFKDSFKSLAKEHVNKIQSKEPLKPVVAKDSNKSSSFELFKSQPKEQTKYPLKEVAKDTSKSPTKEAVKPPIKPFFFKSHPHRMASLDALARMHVICTTDRRPSEPKHVSSDPVVPFSHQKSITQCHERIQVDVKKETNDFKGNIVHKQEINLKQQVFVSHSSIVEHEQSKTISTKVQHEKEKKKSKLSEKAANDKPVKGRKKQIPAILSKSSPVHSKLEKGKSKISKAKDNDKKSAKVLGKTVSKGASKAIKEKPDTKGSCKKVKKLEQTKSEVKVKETIRMHKTCTYQSVTTVNSHGAASSNVPVSHVGMTTNFSKTKKTVVTDEECKNNVNYSSGSVINNSYCLTTESACSSGRSDCCKVHAHTHQIIPLAHMQTCSLGHRTADGPSAHCDGNFSMHRFGPQQPLIFSNSPSADCSCCCSSPLVQNIHDPCLLRKSIVAYPHHLPSHHTHFSGHSFTEPVCANCHSNNNTQSSQKHQLSQHYTISSPSRVSCCACSCNNHHNQKRHQCISAEPKPSSSLVPCEQTPLDLSLTSSSSASSISIDSDISLQPGHCSSPICCSSKRPDLLLLRTSPHGLQQHQFSTPNSKPCCRHSSKCCSKSVHCESFSADAVQPLPCSNKSIIRIGQQSDCVSLLTAAAGRDSLHPDASTSGVTNKNHLPCVLSDDSLLTAKREKVISPKHSSPVPKNKRMFAHGWSWKGKPKEKLIALTNDSIPCPRVCYPSIQHKEGDTIHERDCVLLRSGPKDTDLPYVAKVSSFWENPDDGEMMMSLLWYYRPEHTDQGRKPGQMEDEVFASRHKDVNSVACIEDKCYVLTYNEYCRYKANMSMEDDMISLVSRMVPELPDGYSRRSRLPSELVAQDIVFFCRHVYDFRQKRILKNPT